MFQSVFILAQTPSMVWINKDGGERNEYVYFRKDVKLSEEPTKATINLYADSRYALYVNEVYIGFGPVRTFHANPTFDTYDIAPYLKKGENTIAVKALSNGMVTYQLFDYKGGFTVWGEIEYANKSIDLDVLKGWVCKKSEGYDQSASRFSFATGAVENLDTRKDINWNNSNISTKKWKKPVVLTDQKIWGELTPRIIPHLTQTEITTDQLMSAYPLSNDEDIYSFRLPINDKTPAEYNDNYSSLVSTYIYSPKEKTVTAGMWWGDYYLNGERIEGNKEQKNSSYRNDFTLNLNKGWNLFVSRHGVIWGSLDYYIALPNNEGLILSPSKNKKSKDIFSTYGPFESLEYNGRINDIDLTKDIKSIKKNTAKSISSKKWKSQNRDKDANSPARDLVWKAIDFSSPINLESKLSGSTKIPVQEVGTALIYDMGEMQLGRIFVEGNFANGTIIDIGFSEELNGKGTPWLYKRYQVGAGHRFTASEEISRYETFKPYGARYLQINILNSDVEVSIEKVGMVRQVYPFKTVGSFKSSDPLLNKIWEAGWTTLQLCSEDSYTDTPFRERGLYAGDFLPESYVTMAVSGDTRLMKQSLNVFQDMYAKEMHESKGNIHADFPLITLLAMDGYVKYTDDWSIVEKDYKNYKSLLNSYTSNKTKEGLYKSGDVFIEKLDIIKHDVTITAQQALIVKSLNTLNAWAIKLNKPEDAKMFKAKADELTKNINDVLWDNEANMFWYGIKNDTLVKSHKLVSSVWPALYNVVDDSRKEEIIESVISKLDNVINEGKLDEITPYGSFYLFPLLYQSGNAEIAEAFMKKHWGPMALHSGTSWEYFGLHDDGTSSHAWSASPTYYLSSEVLGVNLGFYKKLDRNVIEIEPQSATVSWAEGSVSHPLGKVDVSWKVIGNKLALTYKAPEGAKVVVNPKGRLAELELWVNGSLQAK